MRSAALGRVAAIVLLALSLGACASVEVGRARALAKAGTDASAQVDTAAALVVQSYQQGRSDEDLQDAIIGAGESGHSAAFQKVLAQLRARERVAAALKDAYGSFAALANYDAKGEFQQSAHGFFDAVDSAAGISSVNVKTDQAVIEQLGGELLAWRQAGRLKKASAALHKGLATYKIVLEQSSPGYIRIEQQAVMDHYAVIQQLWKTGSLQAQDLIAGVAAEPGLSLAGGDFTHADPKTDRIVTHVLTQRREQALQAVLDADRANRELVGKLIDQHATFEAGGPLSFAELQSSADELVAAAQAIAKAKGGK
jgi:hypothetical protein